MHSKYIKRLKQVAKIKTVQNLIKNYDATFKIFLYFYIGNILRISNSNFIKIPTRDFF